MSRIYTRTGDDGTTGLLYGGRVRKDHPAPAACGDVDEAQAALGLARALAGSRRRRARRAAGRPRAGPVGAHGRAGHRPREPAQARRRADPGHRRDGVAPSNRSSTTSPAASPPPGSSSCPARRRCPPPSTWPAPSSAGPSGPPWPRPPTARTSSPTSTGCPTCCGPWPAGRRASRSSPAPTPRLPPRTETTMPIAVTLADAVPDDAQVLGVPVFAGRTSPEGAGADLDCAYLAERGFEGKVGETSPSPAPTAGATIVAVGVGDAGQGHRRDPAPVGRGPGEGGVAGRPGGDHPAGRGARRPRPGPGGPGRGRGGAAGVVPVHHLQVRPQGAARSSPWPSSARAPRPTPTSIGASSGACGWPGPSPWPATSSTSRRGR